jgi:hypothetical protein
MEGTNIFGACHVCDDFRAPSAGTAFVVDTFLALIGVGAIGTIGSLSTVGLNKCDLLGCLLVVVTVAAGVIGMSLLFNFGFFYFCDIHSWDHTSIPNHSWNFVRGSKWSVFKHVTKFVAISIGKGEELRLS